MSPFWMIWLNVGMSFAVRYSWLRKHLPGIALLGDYEGWPEWQLYLVLILLWPLAAIAND